MSVMTALNKIICLFSVTAFWRLCTQTPIWRPLTCTANLYQRPIFVMTPWRKV